MAGCRCTLPVPALLQNKGMLRTALALEAHPAHPAAVGTGSRQGDGSNRISAVCAAIICSTGHP